MAASDLINLSGLMDDAKRFAFVRQQRWPDGVCCPGCESAAAIRDGHDDTQPNRQRHRCKDCAGRFDDLTGTVLAGHHQPLRVWVLCLHPMGLNLANRQIAMELGLDASDVQAMTEQLRRGLFAKTPEVKPEGDVEIDEVYVVAGHKGQPGAVAKRGGSGAVASPVRAQRAPTRQGPARCPRRCSGGVTQPNTPEANKRLSSHGSAGRRWPWCSHWAWACCSATPRAGTARAGVV